MTQELTEQDAERMRRNVRRFERFAKALAKTARADEWQALARAWPKLSRRVQDAMLVLAGVAKLPIAPGSRRPRSRKGETPNWFQEALTILKETEGQITNKDIAVRLGLSPSALSHSEHFRRARETFPQRMYHGGPRRKRR